jgi:hypothetical protein
MRSFKEYLTESARKYDFKIKIAKDCSSEQESLLKRILERFGVADFKKTGKTPIQNLPLDFPTLKNTEVSIYEVTLDYPTTPQELQSHIGSGLGLTEAFVVVRNPGEPGESYQAPKETREGALLNDSEYKESPNANVDDYYGEKYNAKFLQALNSDLKDLRKARGEVIPGSDQSSN